MKSLRMVVAGLGLAIWAGQSALAEDSVLFPTTAQGEITTVADANNPSVLQRLSSGTKNLLTNTKNALTFKKTTVKKPAKPSAQNKKTWFQSVFGPKDPPKPKTMKDWISQPRPNL